MAKAAALALLLCSASAAVVEEILHPIREVSPDEFHALALRQNMEAEPTKPKRNLLTDAQKKEREQERLQKRRQAQKEKEIEKVEAIFQLHKVEEEEIQQEAQKVLEAAAEKAAQEEAEKLHLPWDPEKKPEVANATVVNLAKAGKSLACTDGKKGVLSLYISQLSGGVSTKQTMDREKCLRSQLDQHCMPYESFPSTLIEPCDAGDWNCANKRVLNDHATCLSKTVDWEAVQNHARDSLKTMWEVLGSWCSHVKLLQEVGRRIKMDEQFVVDYPALLVLEDHVLLDKEWTEEIVKDWVEHYPRHWDMVQLHTTGGKGLKRDKVAEFRQKQVFKPSWHGQYNGAHAVLINTRSVPTLLERMMGLNIVPIEWLTKSLNTDPHGLEILSWESGISTVAWEGSGPLKQRMVPEVASCEAARAKKDKY